MSSIAEKKHEDIKGFPLLMHIEYCPVLGVRMRSVSDFDRWRTLGWGGCSPIGRITVTQADVVSLAGTTQEAEEIRHFSSRQPCHCVCHFDGSSSDS